MSSTRHRLLWLLVFSLLGWGNRVTAHTLVTGVELRETPPPTACSPELVAALNPRCMVVRSYGEDVIRVWSVNHLRLAQAPKDMSDVAYPRITPGALAGVVEVSAAWFDYLDQPVKLGVYTLRYSLTTADPSSLIHARWRDVLLMLPVEKDQDPAREWPVEYLRALATGDREDAVPRRMALFPAPEGRGPHKDEPPKLIANELYQPMLSFWIGTLNLNAVVAGSVYLSNQE